MSSYDFVTESLGDEKSLFLIYFAFLFQKKKSVRLNLVSLFVTSQRALVLLHGERGNSQHNCYSSL